MGRRDGGTDRMRVTLQFIATPGPAQVEAITLRVATSDPIEALTKALEFVRGNVTTAAPATITIEQEQTQ